MIDARGEPCVNGDFADLFVFTSLNETFINDSSTLHIVQFSGRNTNAVLRKASNRIHLYISLRKKISRKTKKD